MSELFSKFSSKVAEAAYEIANCGFADEEIGTVDELGWYARLDGPFTPEDVENYPLLKKDSEAVLKCAGIIVKEDSQGFVSAEVYEDIDKFEVVWDDIVAQYCEDDEDEDCYSDADPGL